MLEALRVQYDQVERQDASVTVAPDAEESVRTELAALGGTTAVEPSRVGAVTVAAGGSSYATQLQGFVPGTDMHGFRDPDGDPVPLPDDGVLAGSALADQLSVGVGDELTLTASDGSATTERLAGFVDEPLGTSVYATNRVAGSVLRDTGARTLLVRYADGTDRDRVRDTVTQLDGVLAYADSDALLRSLDRYLGLFWAFVGIMVGLGAVLALAIIYVSMAVTVVERTNELATLRAAGVPLRRIAATLATENLLATLLGIPFGLALGWVAADRFMALYSGDLFTLPLYLPWWALALAALGVILAAALSQLPAVRAVRRLDVARVVRERAM
jgi:putative ABC transport system permease protein